MTEEERLDKFQQFNILAEKSNGKDVEQTFHLVMKYDAPPISDRDFVFDCLIQYYSLKEEFEKCAQLLEKKNNKRKRKRFSAKSITLQELYLLKALMYKVPDNVIMEVLKKYNY